MVRRVDVYIARTKTQTLFLLWYSKIRQSLIWEEWHTLHIVVFDVKFLLVDIHFRFVRIRENNGSSQYLQSSGTWLFSFGMSFLLLGYLVLHDSAA